MTRNTEQAFTTQKLAGKTLLLVEPDESVAFFLRLLIQEEFDCDVLVAPTARQALELVRQLHFDLFMLTDAYGMELYDHLHTQPGLEHVPAILLTANLAHWQNEIMRRDLIGLNKPCKPVELLTTINFLLTLEHIKTGSAA
ncbi:MAG TPA: hypothetical protein VKV40_05665 [Ktedonobacteraceae bacterium]|nr:hypothetical protein [Ktedonobacteraceae bacterium]